MAQKCSCGESGHGKVGALIFCRSCMEELSGLPRRKFKRPQRIEIQDGGRVIGHTLWVPWKFMNGGS